MDKTLSGLQGVNRKRHGFNCYYRTIGGKEILLVVLITKVYSLSVHLCPMAFVDIQLNVLGSLSLSTWLRTSIAQDFV